MEKLLPLLSISYQIAYNFNESILFLFSLQGGDFKLLEKFIKGESKIEWIITGVFFCMMMIMTTGNVFSRYLLNESWPFAEELSYLGFTWSVFIGMGHCFRTRSLVAVDIFVDHMPKSLQKISAVVADLILLLSNCGLLYLGTRLAISGWTRRSVSLRIPYTFYYLPVVIVSLIMIITSIYFLMKHFKPSDKREEDVL